MNAKQRFDTIARKVYAGTAALVGLVPVLVGAFTQDANTTRTVLEYVAGGVAVFDGALYLAQRFGFLLDLAQIPESAAAPAPVVSAVKEAETVADAATAVKKATK